MREPSPIDKFKAFVTEILTVTKDDIRKAEDTATDLLKPVEPCPPDGEG